MISRIFSGAHWVVSLVQSISHNSRISRTGCLISHPTMHALIRSAVFGIHAAAVYRLLRFLAVRIYGRSTHSMSASVCSIVP